MPPAACQALGIREPCFDEAVSALFADPDRLTHTLAAATLPPELHGNRSVVPDHIDTRDEKLAPVEVALQLRAIPIFRRLSTRQLIDLAKVIRQEDYPPGSMILRENDAGESMYLVVQGHLQVLKGQTLLRNLEPGDFFGEMAVLEREIRSASVLAQSDVRLLHLQGNDLLVLIEEFPLIAVNICRYLSHRVLELDERMQRLDIGSSSGGVGGWPDEAS